MFFQLFVHTYLPRYVAHKPSRCTWFMEILTGSLSSCTQYQSGTSLGLEIGSNVKGTSIKCERYTRIYAAIFVTASRVKDMQWQFAPAPQQDHFVCRSATWCNKCPSELYILLLFHKDGVVDQNKAIAGAYPGFHKFNKSYFRLQGCSNMPHGISVPAGRAMKKQRSWWQCLLIGNRWYFWLSLYLHELHTSYLAKPVESKLLVIVLGNSESWFVSLDKSEMEDAGCRRSWRQLCRQCWQWWW